ncbi:hypothetical protein [Mollivirus kamchatka]|nr:hypothetical protein [Mollivirus kamchatka]
MELDRTLAAAAVHTKPKLEDPKSANGAVNKKRGIWKGTRETWRPIVRVGTTGRPHGVQGLNAAVWPKSMLRPMWQCLRQHRAMLCGPAKYIPGSDPQCTTL